MPTAAIFTWSHALHLHTRVVRAWLLDVPLKEAEVAIEAAAAAADWRC